MKPRTSLYMSGTFYFKDEDLEDIIRMSVLPKRKVEMPSMSNASKAVKDKLQEDPYNIELIKELGLIYGSEAQWDKAANVMMRGWKRASELKDPRSRFEFLIKLAEASFRNRQFRQTAAILMDIDEPEDYYERKAYQLLSCHTYAENGDAPKALAVFSKAVEGEDFETSIKIWAAVALRLRAVGAFEAAKNAVMNKARSGPNYYMDQSRLQTVESWAIMSSTQDDTPKGWEDYFNFDDGIPKWIIYVGVAFVSLIIIYVLYCIERRSLESWRLK